MLEGHALAGLSFSVSCSGDFKKFNFIITFVGCMGSSLWRMGLVILTQVLSCPAACGLLVPRPGIEPVSLPCKADS